MNEKAKALTFTSLGHFINDGFLVIFPILSIYYISMGINPTAIGIFGAVYNFLSGFLGAPVGKLGDESGKYSELMYLGFLLIALGGVSYLVSFLTGSLVLRYIFVFLGSLFLGFGLGFYHPLGGAILQHKFEKQEAPRALGINGALGSLGRALAPYVFVSLFEALGIKMGLGMMVVFTIIISTIIYFGLKGVSVEVKEERKENGASGSVKPYMYVIVPLTIIVFVRSMFIAGVQLFAPTYLAKIYISKQLVGIFLTVSYATAIVGQPFFGDLTARIGGRLVVYITTVFSTAFYLIFLFVQSFYAQLISFALFAFFALSGFPNLLGYVSQVVDKSVFARANGIVWSYGNMLGGALGMIIGGPIIQYLGFFEGMLAYGLLGVVSSVLLIMLPKTRK